MPLAAIRARFEAWLNDRPDDAVLRWLYRGLLVAAAAVLVLDYGELGGRTPDAAVTIPATPPGVPAATTARPAAPAGRRAHRPRPKDFSSDPQLAAAMSFDLQADGRLVATGTIQPGTAKAFAAEIEKRGSYVKTVSLHSPGGSVSDALQMGRLIRGKQFATEVSDGHLCVSSCPLVLAGGVERSAGDKAVIGVHQVTALGDGLTADEGMESVQRISAECQKYLREMGIDALVWIHAMETPREDLFYFTAAELFELKLATQHPDPTAAAALDRRKS